MPSNPYLYVLKLFPRVSVAMISKIDAIMQSILWFHYP